MNAEQKTINKCIECLTTALKEVEWKYRSNEGEKMAYGYRESIKLLQALLRDTG